MSDLTMGRGARWAAAGLLLLTVITGAGNLWATYEVAHAQHTQLINCQQHAEQEFDAAIEARTRDSAAVNASMQALIITVFSAHGSHAYLRRVDLAAYAAWRIATAKQEAVTLPSLPTRACS